MSKVFFTSDQHFYHKKVIYYCNRPFSSVEEMNAELIRLWNETVGPEDTVWVLGDFAFCGIEKMSKILKQLNGYKIMVMGNHDGWNPEKLKRAGFSFVHTDPVTLRVHGQKITLCHYPYPPSFWENLKFRLKSLITKGKWTHKELRYMNLRPFDDGRWLLHGHVHNCWKVKNRMINVGVDVHAFRPISLAEVVKLINENGGIPDAH